MRVTMYILILAALLFVPLQPVEIANLEPIQAVRMYTENESIVLETDTEDKGIGATVEIALNDMKHNSAGIIYLDTAQYLFVSSSAVKNISATQPYFKDSVQLCIWDGQGDIKEVVKYADSHKLGLKMRQWKKGGTLPELGVIQQTAS